VTVVAGDGKGLRRHDTPETAFRREFIIVVNTVGVVHGLGPAADIIVRQRLLEAARLNRFAHVVVEVGTVQGLVVHRV
jgi:hypothetical protein